MSSVLYRPTVRIMAAVLVASAGAVAEGAESSAIPACVNKTTGEVRIVSDASQCRVSENPIQLASADTQVWSERLRSLTAASEELTVPDLGMFTLACVEFPVGDVQARLRLTIEQPVIQIRPLVGQVHGGTSTQLFGTPGTAIDLSSPTLETYWFSSDAGTWKVDALAADAGIPSCNVAVIVTRTAE